MGEVTPQFLRGSATILAGRDPVRCAVWAGALVLLSLEVILRSGSVWRAAGETAMPFLTLAAIIAAAAFAERLGAFTLLARVMIPATASTAVVVAAVLLFTATLSGLVNLDVAVVVAMPVALIVAQRQQVSVGWLAAAVAVTANATSFLLPTSNVTTPLVLSASGGPGNYVRDSWVAWVFVTTLTVGALSLVVSRQAGAGTLRATGDGPRLGAVLDLLPMFLAASAIRGLLSAGVVLNGSFIEQVTLGSAFGAVANNLPAAAAVHVTGTSGLWAAVLAMSIGPNLLITGSVATLICRRIARDGGATVSALCFSAMGVVMVPMQLVAGFIGLHLTGALR